MRARQTVCIDLSHDMLLAIGHAARAEGTSPSDLVRQILGDALLPGPVRVGDSHALVRGAIANARGWLDLQARLRRLGFVLRYAGASGLWLHSWPEDRALCPAGDVGAWLAPLVLRFGAPFPGGPDRALPKPAERPREKRATRAA